MARRGAEAAEWWSSLRPGDKYSLTYAGDHVAHERVAIWPSEEAGHWFGLTPDGDVYAEDLACRNAKTGPKSASPLPPGTKPRSRLPLYRFREAVDREDLVRHITETREIETAADDANAPKFVFFDGKEILLHVFSGGAELPLDAEDAKPPAGTVWRLDDGSDLDLARARVVTPDGLAGLVWVAGGWRVFRAVDPKAKKEDDLDAVEDLERRLGLDKSGAETPRGKNPDDDHDVRVLDVCWDEQGERFREWRSVTKESTQESFADAPYEGPATCLHMSKVMLRQGGDPRLWVERFLRDKRLDNGDRTAHELKTLCDILWAAGCYDQLNLGSLSCLEMAARRVATIIEAYADPSKVNWTAAKFFREAGGIDEAIPPALRQHVLRRAKDEADIIATRSRIGARQTPQWSPDAGDGGEPKIADGGDAGRGGGRGRGRGRSRGLPSAQHD